MFRSAPCALLLLALPLRAQEHRHVPGMTHPSAPVTLVQPGQAAFGTIGEIVRVLMADSTTDWTRVDLEALRQHLIDMDDVTMRANAVARPVSGGAVFDVSGTGRTRQAIRRIVIAHAEVLNRMDGMRATANATAAGARMTVTGTVESTTGRIRGLGFIGLLTLGEHHGPHHLEIARGSTTPHAHH